MKNLIYLSIVLIIAGCIQTGSQNFSEIPFGTKVAVSYDEMTSGEKFMYNFNNFLGNSRDTVIVVSGFSHNFVIDKNGILQNQIKESVCMDINLVGAFFCPGGAASKSTKLIKIIATIDDPAIGLVKNHKYLEVSAQGLKQIEKVFEIKKITNTSYAVHGLDRALQRGINFNKIIKGLSKPNLIENAKLGRYLYVYDDITLVVTEQQKVVTTYFTGIY